MYRSEKYDAVGLILLPESVALGRACRKRLTFDIVSGKCALETYSKRHMILHRYTVACDEACVARKSDDYVLGSQFVAMQMHRLFLSDLLVS